VDNNVRDGCYEDFTFFLYFFGQVVRLAPLALISSLEAFCFFADRLPMSEAGLISISSPHLQVIFIVAMLAIE